MSAVDTIKLLGILNLTPEQCADIVALSRCRRRRPPSGARALELERLTLAKRSDERKHGQWELTQLGRRIAAVIERENKRKMRRAAP